MNGLRHRARRRLQRRTSRNDLEFWKRATTKYDQACLGEYVDGLVLQPEECGYMKWRVEVSKLFITSNKAMELCDGGSKQKTVRASRRRSHGSKQ